MHNHFTNKLNWVNYLIRCITCYENLSNFLETDFGCKASNSFKSVLANDKIDISFSEFE